jgi:serine/threonine protein kinase
VRRSRASEAVRFRSAPAPARQPASRPARTRAPAANPPRRKPALRPPPQGLDYLHGKKIVHFDLKSANVLVGIRDKVPLAKVCDFGLAKQRRQTYVTGVTSLRGSLPWMAPEILKAPDAVDERSDIFSFGVVM